MGWKCVIKNLLNGPIYAFKPSFQFQVSGRSYNVCPISRASSVCHELRSKAAAILLVNNADSLNSAAGQLAEGAGFEVRLTHSFFYFPFTILSSFILIIFF